ncbi:hypothetical protein SDC9_128477 [bioreactor metagenome]|uniref:Uncharacterized protein n=1 Tax=bioreactor metagenome TaxID=1076179 RepID=A0A645CWW6_9ZZZZ
MVKERLATASCPAPTVTGLALFIFGSKVNGGVTTTRNFRDMLPFDTTMEASVSVTGKVLAMDAVISPEAFTAGCVPKMEVSPST